MVNIDNGLAHDANKSKMERTQIIILELGIT
jgi:hypothetical protein